jgi:hypothetical protein
MERNSRIWPGIIPSFGDGSVKTQVGSSLLTTAANQSGEKPRNEGNKETRRKEVRGGRGERRDVE